MHFLEMVGPIGLIVIGVIIVLLPLIALIDILTHEFTGSNKIIWVFIVIFFPVMGAILYFLIGTRQKIR
ncbi:MAG: PLDc_N domain-containing protein [Bacteroidales bacterium]|nr:PLDc_N domain-containing protein [Bacteroidales bacterium]